jgi:P4 family phage/plasmid primase-like protien
MFQVSLQAVKSKLDGIKLFEVVNKADLSKIISSPFLLTTKWDSFDNEKNQLEYYKDQGKDYDENNIIVPVKYKRAAGSAFGRVYPIKSLSLSAIRKEVRHTIAKNLYIDIDIENCHPNIVYQACINNNILVSTLGEYITNREEILKQTMIAYKVNRDIAKSLFIIILYFGSFYTWIKKNNLDITFKPTPFITNLIEERSIYGKYIEDNNNEIYLDVQKRKTKKNILEYNETASVVACWCQEIENRMLELIYEYSISKKYISKKIVVLCADGIMIEQGKFKDTIPSEFSKIIKDATGYNLMLTTKPLNKGYTLEIPATVPSNIPSVVVNIDIKDKAFFKQLETLGHIQCAEIYYNIHSNKYIYSTISGWYAYNQFNVLESTGENAPSGILKSISKTLEKHISPIRNRMKANSPSYRLDNLNITKLLININKIGYLNDIIKALKELYIVVDVDSKFDNNSKLLAFSDKVFDASICAIRDISPSDYISKTTKYEYSISNETIREEINDVIHSIFEDVEIEHYFKQIKAQSLFGNINESCIIQVGSGGNGKGIISTVETTALGDYIKTTENTFITSAFKQGAANPTLASSKGVRNLIVSEPAEDDEIGRATSINTPFLKLITGNDNIETRQLYSKNICFKPQFTPFIQCNTLPNIKKIDKGIMRRIKVIEFPLSFVENPIEHYERKIDLALKAKFSSIVYAREYLLILLEQYKTYQGSPLITPSKVLAKTNNYFTDSNPVKTYIDSFILKKVGSRIRSSELLENYLGNCEDKMSSKAFIAAMSTNGIINYMSSGYRYFKDIELLD